MDLRTVCRTRGITLGKSKILWMIIVAALFAFTSLRRQYQDTLKRKQKQEVSEVKNEAPAEVDPAAQNPNPFPINQENTPVAVESDSTESNESEELNQIADYSIPDETIIEKWQGRESKLVAALVESAQKGIACLKDNLCGEKPSSEDPYFDPNNTPSHSKLERELGLLIKLREQNKLDFQAVPNQFLEESLDIQNTTIQNYAIELRMAAGIDDNGYAQLLYKTPSLMPESAATALVMLAKESQVSQARRADLIATTQTLLTSEDQLRAVEVSKRIQYLDVNKNEIEQLSKSTCGLLPQNRKTVQNNLAIAGEGVGANLNFGCN